LRKHWGKALIGLGVTVLFLWMALRGVRFQDVWTHILSGNFWLLGAAVAVATSSFLIRALRWKVLLAPVKPDTDLHARWAAVSIGFMANNVLPARVGEFARAYAFSRMESVSASAAFGSLVVERALDGIVLLLFLAVPVLMPGFPVAGVLTHGVGATALRGAVLLVSVIIVGVVALAIWPGIFVRIANRVAGTILPRAVARPLIDALEAFTGSLALVRSPKLLGVGFLWTVVLWTYNGFSFWLGMKAFGIDTGMISACFTQAVVGFGVAIPSAPGFIGTFEASARFSLTTVFGVEPGRALAFVFGYHFGSWIPITVIGLAYAWKLGFSLGEVGEAEERVESVIEEEQLQTGGVEGGEA